MNVVVVAAGWSAIVPGAIALGLVFLIDAPHPTHQKDTPEKGRH